MQRSLPEVRAGFKQVGRVERAARYGAGADDGVDLVYEEDGLVLLEQLVDDAF